jgi:hypothetical protein
MSSEARHQIISSTIRPTQPGLVHHSVANFPQVELLASRQYILHSRLSASVRNRI